MAYAGSLLNIVTGKPHVRSHHAGFSRASRNVATMADRFPDATPENIRQDIDALRGDGVMHLSMRDIDEQLDLHRQAA
jgi:hypothetical protein